MEGKQNALAKISQARLELMEAKTPEDTLRIESLATIAEVLAKEIGFHPGQVEACRLKYQARRKTAEVIRPLVGPTGGSHGARSVVRVEDLNEMFGITRSQWEEYLKQAKVRDDLFERYFDEALDKPDEDPGWRPLLRWVDSVLHPGKKKTVNPQSAVSQAIAGLRIVSAAYGRLRRVTGKAMAKKNASDVRKIIEEVEKLLKGLYSLAKNLDKYEEGEK